MPAVVELPKRAPSCRLVLRILTDRLCQLECEQRAQRCPTFGGNDLGFSEKVSVDFQGYVLNFHATILAREYVLHEYACYTLRP